MPGTTPRPPRGGALWPGAERGEPIPPPSPKPLAAPDTRSTWTRPPAPTPHPVPAAPPLVPPGPVRPAPGSRGWLVALMVAVVLALIAAIAVTWVVLAPG